MQPSSSSKPSPHNIIAAPPPFPSPPAGWTDALHLATGDKGHTDPPPKKIQPRATPETKATNSNRKISVFREGESSNSYQLSARAERVCTISKFTTLNMESFTTLQTTILKGGTWY